MILKGQVRKENKRRNTQEENQQNFSERVKAITKIYIQRKK